MLPALPRLLFARAFLATVIAAAVTLTGNPGAWASSDVVRAASTYAQAGRALQGQVLLWEPTYTLGLSRKREIDVLAYGSGSTRATFAGSSYGKRVPSFTLAQKAAATKWAAKPVQHSSERLVETVRIQIGDRGAKRPVQARIYANCAPGAQSSKKRCERRDVARFGGSVVLLARTAIDGAPIATDVRIDSTGMSYEQLLRIARGLRPVD